MPTPDRIKIIGGHVVTMTGEEIPGGELIVEDGVIREVSRRPVEPYGGRVLDWRDCLVMPGFVNAHAHLALSALGDRLTPGMSFPEWAEQLLPLNAALPQEERRAALNSAARTLLRSGVTLLADYLGQPELLGEYRALPFRQVIFLEALGFQRERADAAAEWVRRTLSEWDSSGGRILPGIAAHACYSVAPELFRALKHLAEHHRCAFSTHLAEFPEEGEFLHGKGKLLEFVRRLGAYDAAWRPPGSSPAAYLEKLGVLDSLLGIHMNHVDGDLELLRRNRVSAVFCPGSTRWFARQRLMPARALMDAGLAVGIGTDSLASNESLDFLRELRLAEEMLPDASRMEILRMATGEGARALGLNAGVLAPGRPADIIAFKMTRGNADWMGALFDPSRKGADAVMIGGKVEWPLEHAGR